MAKMKILVSGRIAQEGITELQKHFTVFYDPTITTRDWILTHLAEYDGLIATNLSVDQEIINAGTRLKIITTYGVGFDHVDIKYAKQHGILVANCPTSVRKPTAEMALTLLLDVTRRVSFYDRQMRAGKWVDVSLPTNMGTSLAGKTLGIYGMGRIGSTVAKMAQLLGMKVIYHNRHQLSADHERALGVQYVDFATLVTTADVISLHAPATPTTQGVFNRTVFKQMKETAYLINTARGALVNQHDLVQALAAGDIAGAGLDVFHDEPTVPVELTKLDNVVLSPHAGTGTHEARAAIATEAANNLVAFLINGQATNQVN